MLCNGVRSAAQIEQEAVFANLWKISEKGDF